MKSLSVPENKYLAESAVDGFSPFVDSSGPTVTAAMVAQWVGVSEATISRVINKRSVHPDTVMRVRQAIKELGFAPSAPISKQRRALRGKVALLCPASKLESMTRAPLLNSVLHGIISTLSERGLYLIQNTLDNSHSLLAQHKVDGVIVWPNLVDVPQATIEMLRPYPVVYLMSMPEVHLPGDRVKPNNKTVGMLAAQYLLAQGHQRLACVSTSGLESWLWERSSVFLSMANSGAGSANSPVFESIECDSDGGIIENNQEFEDRMIEGLQRILNSTPLPTGWFVTSDALTVYVYRHLKKLGVQIGKDIEIISCHNEIPILNCLDPRPKSIDLRAEEIGKKTVERLLWRMEHPALEGSYFSVEVEPRLC